jgi:hypothetical protein
MHSSIKFASLFAAAAGLVPGALAHYNFEALIVNGETTGPYEYVRRTTNYNSPIEDVTSPNMACNAGGSDPEIMAATGTMTVQAGDQLGFTVASEIGHPGPQAVYLSKAPGSASEYAGDGDWFKIYELTYSEITAEGLKWATSPSGAGGIKNFTFTLPAEVPSGEYLLRAEHVGLHSAGSVGGAQFYIGCAQLKVEGGGSGTPGPTVKFPGAYDGSEPGIHINIYYPPPQSYTMFGPAPWPNACTDHTANLDGQESDGDCTGDDGASAPPTPSDPVEEEPEESTAPTPVETGDATPTATPTATVTSTPAPTQEPIEEPVEEECPARRRRRRSTKSRKARRNY